MELKKVQLHELDEFILSEFYQALNDKPISPFRAESYRRNPHGLPGDKVLYLLIDEGKLIAYRTLFPAMLTGQNERFAWLSGNWVHPDYRRKGYSEQLLEEILNDWNYRLMFTNYAPASLQLYLKSGQFQLASRKEGLRFYFFAKTTQLLGHRYKPISFIFPMVDFIIDLATGIRLFTYKPKTSYRLTTEQRSYPDSACFSLVEKRKKDYLFLRGKQEFEWIFNYPWISMTNSEYREKYAFSSFAKQFQYKTIKFFEEDQLVGFLICLLKDGQLKTVHVELPSEFYPVAADSLINVAVENKVETLTVLTPELAAAIKKSKHPFWFSKRMEQGIFASFSVSAKGKKIQDGDGDFIFT